MNTLTDFACYLWLCRAETHFNFFLTQHIAACFLFPISNNNQCFTAIIHTNLRYLARPVKNWGMLRTGCKVLLPALADGSQCIRIREKMLEFSTAFSTPSPYHSLLLNMCIIMIEGACSDEALMLHVLPNMILEPYRQNPLIYGRILCITEPYGCLSRLRLSQ